MIINHASENWGNFIPKKVKTLVLGSFNPNNHMGQNANYYYGRNTNYMWKAIGDILYGNQQFFFNNGLLNNELAFQTMNKYSFCFLDLISSIQITGNNEQHENNFRAERIYNGFRDSVLFTTNTNFENFNINIQRNYNQNIISFLQNYKNLSQNRIFHS